MSWTKVGGGGLIIGANLMIPQYSIICNLKKVAKKLKIGHCENYRIYGNMIHVHVTR